MDKFRTVVLQLAVEVLKEGYDAEQSLTALWGPLQNCSAPYVMRRQSVMHGPESEACLITIRGMCIGRQVRVYVCVNRPASADGGGPGAHEGKTFSSVAEFATRTPDHASKYLDALRIRFHVSFLRPLLGETGPAPHITALPEHILASRVATYLLPREAISLEQAWKGAREGLDVDLLWMVYLQYGQREIGIPGLCQQGNTQGLRPGGLLDLPHAARIAAARYRSVTYVCDTHNGRASRIGPLRLQRTGVLYCFTKDDVAEGTQAVTAEEEADARGCTARSPPSCHARALYKSVFAAYRRRLSDSEQALDSYFSFQSFGSVRHHIQPPVLWIPGNIFPDRRPYSPWNPLPELEPGGRGMPGGLRPPGIPVPGLEELARPSHTSNLRAGGTGSMGARGPFGGVGGGGGAGGLFS